jgi:hypothetical protein
MVLEVVSICIASMKLASSLNHYVPDCCFWRAIVVLVTGLRRDQIYQKAESVAYNFGIQGFQSVVKSQIFSGH